MKQRQNLKVFGLASAISTTMALGIIGAANAAASNATPVFNYSSGFVGSYPAIRTAFEAALQGADLNVTSNLSPHSAGAAWYTAPQNITSFTTQFTFQLGLSVAKPAIQGITFCIQNTTSAANPNFGANAIGDANLSGYGAYALPAQYPNINSIAVKFDLNNNSANNFPAGGLPNFTGLYINSGPGGALIPELDLNPSGINLYSGHVMAVSMVYDGSLLTMTLRDTVTNAQYRTSWPVDIPVAVKSNSAWIGFTGGEINPVANNILSWSFSEGYAPRLATPTFSVAAGSYPSEQTVSISAPSGSTIYYTTNGQQPTTSSTKYTGPISVNSSEAIQAVAIQSGFTDSLVSVSNYQIAPAGSPLINFANGFASAANLITVNGSAQFNGSALQLTDTARSEEAGTAWYAVPVNVQSFNSNFTMQLLNPVANGLAFVIQNQPPASSDGSILYVSGGPNAIANNANGLGFSGGAGTGAVNAGLLSSAALIFDLYDGSGNSTGLYTNGALPTGSSTDMTSSGLNLHSGNSLAVSIGYDGSNLKMTITDTKSKAAFSKSWPIDIPAIVGGKTAYVGFTGGTGGLTALQKISSWTFSNSGAVQSQTAPPPTAVPAPPTNLRVQ